MVYGSLSLKVCNWDNNKTVRSMNKMNLKNVKNKWKHDKNSFQDVLM